MTYRFLEHATDAIVEVDGANLNDAFLEAANATVDLTLNRGSVIETGSVTFEAQGKDLYYLLFSWLEEIIFVLITRGFAIKRVVIEDATWYGDGDGTTPYVRASAHGEPLDLKRHEFRVEIKAPTFHDMEVTKSGGGVLMRFLLDL